MFRAQFGFYSAFKNISSYLRQEWPKPSKLVPLLVPTLVTVILCGSLSDLGGLRDNTGDDAVPLGLKM